MRMFVTHVTAILYLTLAEPTYADLLQAQDFPKTSSVSQKLKKSFEKKCPSMVPNIAMSKEDLLSPGSTENAEAICTCATERTFSDTQVVKLLNMFEETLKSPNKSEVSKQFLAKKLVASILGCTSDNLNEQLNSVNLEF